MDMVEVSNVTKRYGNKVALQQVSLSIGKGEVFGILGHNGAGKTTLMETMLGLKHCDDGRVSIMGHDMSVRDKQVFERIGVQLQQSAYQNKIKVKEVCEERTALYAKPNDYKKMLEDFSLQDKMNQSVESLSGGERQKLSILLAVINQPEIIFLDELTTGLDVVARREIWKYLLGLKKQGKSIVLTSHYMDEVEVLCDRVLILKEGKELASGSVPEVIAKSPYKTLEEAYLWYMEEEELL